MNKRKIIEGILVVIIGIIISLWLGSQFFAYKTKYNHLLIPLYKRIYNPFSIISWYYKYKKSAPILINSVCSFISFVEVVYSFIIYIILIKRSDKTTHGSARFSHIFELKKKGYLVNNFKNAGGVIIGKTKCGKIIIDFLKTHILAIAPSRSGKGVGMILPTLVTWVGSCICFDVKGENHNKTSKYRQDNLNNKIFRLSPYDLYGGSSFNPLSEIRIKTGYEIKDCNIIANILTAPEPGKQRDHFLIAANSGFISIFIHLLYKNKSASLGDVYDFLTEPGTIVEKFQNLLEARYISDKNVIKSIYGDSKYKEEGIHPIVVQGATEILNKSEREMSAVISTILNKLELFKDPVIRKNTSSSDFKITDIMDYKDPVTVYFCVKEEEMDALGLFIRIFLTQFIGISMRTEQHKHECLMLLDEFPLYGKLPTIERALGVVASYGIKIMLIAQNTEQIEKEYGKVNTIKQGCATSIFYAPVSTDIDTCKLISSILGSKTISFSTRSGKRMGGILEGNYSNQKKSRKLLEPEEVIPFLGEDKNIIFLGGCHPTIGKKIYYYEENYYNGKILSKEDSFKPEKWAKIDSLK